MSSPCPSRGSATSGAHRTPSRSASTRERRCRGSSTAAACGRRRSPGSTTARTRTGPATGPYFGSSWESSQGVNAHLGHRQRFLSAWTGADLGPSQVVDFPVFPWHVADWKGSAFSPKVDVLREFVLEPIASTGARWAFGFGKDWWELIEALELPILDQLGDGGRPYPTQVDHRRWLVAEGPDGLRVAAMRLDGMPTPPKKEEVEELRRVLEDGPAGANRTRNLSTELETDVSARLRELDMSYMNIARLDRRDRRRRPRRRRLARRPVRRRHRPHRRRRRRDHRPHRVGRLPRVRTVRIHLDARHRRRPPPAAPTGRRCDTARRTQGGQAARHVPRLLQRAQPRRHLPDGVRSVDADVLVPGPPHTCARLDAQRSRWANTSANHSIDDCVIGSITSCTWRAPASAKRRRCSAISEASPRSGSIGPAG